MLSESQSALIFQKAYLPEHLPQYFIPFSGMEPYLINNCLLYIKDDTVSFIGYPLLEETEAETLSTLRQVVKDYNPAVFKAILPRVVQVADYKIIGEEQDEYSKINLDSVSISSKTRNMIRRGGQELEVFIGQEFTMEHLQVLLQFLRSKTLKEEAVDFFHRLPDFLSYSSTATLLEARCKKTGSLAAYNVMEFSSGDYCFFLFNIRSNQPWPGASDLLMEQMITLAKSRGKKYLNTGLAINGGIERFKAKWGAEVFLPYRFISAQPKMPWNSFGRNLKKLARGES
ncbi:MAG: hypothetical protein ACOY9Y_13805 [Bacillota bacterium]